jgi:sugar O-acyltransferase (sialic acid O-acetyltransferase NeuD family)
MNAFLIVGASGFGREVLWVCRRAGLEVTGFCDDAPDKQSGEFAGLPLLGTIERAAARFGTGTRFHCAVGDNRARQRLAARALAARWEPLALVDPSAVCAPDAALGAGCYVGIGSVVSCASTLGSFVLVNHHATVGHDCRLGDFAQICPGARLSGGCALGEGALLGSNAVLLPEKKMGAWSVLGAGTVGVGNLADSARLVRVR